MPAALNAAENVRDAATAAAAAVSRTLPVESVPEAPVEGGEPFSTPLPEAAAKAVTASVRGAVDGTLIVVPHPQLADALENGPVGPAALVDALGPALDDAAAALGQFLGAPVTVSAAQEIDAQIALPKTDDGRVGAGVLLRSDGEIAASVVLILDPPAPAIPAQSRGAEPAGAQFPSFGAAAAGAPGSRSLELLHEVEMGVTAELGRTRMTVKDLLSLAPGAVVELDRAAGSPVDLLVNGTLIARGEVVVIDEEYGVRISEIVNAHDADSHRR